MWRKLSKKIKIVILFVYGMLFVSLVLTVLRTMIMGRPYLGEWTLLLSMIMLGIFTITNIIIICYFKPNNKKNSNKFEKWAFIIVFILLLISFFYDLLKLYAGLDFVSWVELIKMSMYFVMIVISFSMIIKSMMRKKQTE